MDIVEVAKELGKSLSRRQKEMLIALLDECKTLGASSKELAPLLGCLYIDWNFVPSEEDMKQACEIIDKYIK